MTKEAMKQALEALKDERDKYLEYSTEDGAPEYIYEAIRSLEFEVAKQEQGEPVYLIWFEGSQKGGWIDVEKHKYDKTDEEDRWLLYTTPPAQPAPVQEPVAWATMLGSYSHVSWGKDRPDYPIRYEVPLYTTPQRKPLTNEQMWNLWNMQGIDEMNQQEAIAFAREIESAHGIKK